MISYHSLWQLQKAEHHKTDIFDHSVRLSDVNLEANVRSNGSVKTTSSNCDSRDKLLADISATPLMIFTVALFRPESDQLVPHTVEYVPTHKTSRHTEIVHRSKVALSPKLLQPELSSALLDFYASSLSP